MKAFDHKQKGSIGQTQTFQSTTNICLSVKQIKVICLFHYWIPTHDNAWESPHCSRRQLYNFSSQLFSSHTSVSAFVFVSTQFGQFCMWQSVLDLHLKENVSTSAIMNWSISALSLAPTLAARSRMVEELWKWKETKLAPTVADFLQGNSEGRLCTHM